MKLKATLKLHHMTVRREKAGPEDGDIGTDLKLTGELHLKDLRKLFNEDRGYAILEGLYDAEGNLATMAFATVVLSAKGSAVEAAFKTEISGTAIKLRDVEVDQFELVPKIGRLFEISFRVKANPSETQIGQLAEKLKSDLIVDLWSRQAELQFGEVEEEEEEEEEPA